MNVKLAELLSNNEGRFPFYVTKDYYPVYYITNKGVNLCPYCANLILKGRKLLRNDIIADDLEDYKINWDNYTLVCARGHIIESATMELEVPEISNRGKIHVKNKRKVPNKIGHVQLHSNGKQAYKRH